VHRYLARPENPQVNWKESLALKEQIISEGKQLWDGETGEKWIIYFDQKWFLKIHWAKNLKALQMKNKKRYRFLPARGLTGPKTKLKDLIKEDDLAYLNFKWMTYDL